jgi:protein-disulfide isomerase
MLLKQISQTFGLVALAATLLVSCSTPPEKSQQAGASPTATPAQKTETKTETETAAKPPAITPEEKAAFAKQVEQKLENPTKVPLGNSPVLGPKDAPITLVEFSDFQCPYCGLAQPTLKELEAKYKGKMKLVFKHFPLTQAHENAMAAALAAWSAQQQGKFFEYHDLLFKRQKDLQDSTLITIAKEVKLDLKRFNKDRASAQAKAAIEKDMQLGTLLSVQSTPTLILNGVAMPAGLPLEAYDIAIEVWSKKTGTKI